jgi:hypothetical protein
MLPLQNEQNISVHRITRWMAIFGIFYGIFELINNSILPLVTLLANTGIGRTIFNGVPGWSRMSNFIYWICVSLLTAAPIVLLIGSVALLRWKRWGRNITIAWAGVVIIAGLILDSHYFYDQVWSLRPLTQPNLFMAWRYLSNWIGTSIIPAAFVYVLDSMKCRIYGTVRLPLKCFPSQALKRTPRQRT